MVGSAAVTSDSYGEFEQVNYTGFELDTTLN
jgi:hypothetical protein